MAKQKYHEISAVHEKNLRELLEGLDLLKDVENGCIKCRFCEKRITLENLQCIYPKDDEIVFCCEDIKCFEQALRDSV